MPSHWVVTTVGDLLAGYGGSIKTGPFGTTLKAAEYSSDGIPLISVREIGYGVLRVDASTPRVPSEVVERLPEYILEPGDIVFGRKGAVDRSAIVREEQGGWFLGSDGIRLRLPDVCDPRFIAYQLQSPRVRSWLLQNATGTTMASLNQEAIERIPIVLPTLPEQRAIAHILGTLDDKIELNRRMNETLEAMARALFKSWFVDFDPIRAKATRRQPVGMNAELAAQFPDRFEATDLGNVPAEWKRASFGTIAENWRHAIDPQDLAPDTPYIGLEHMRTKSLSLDIWGTAGSVTSGKTRFQRGDVLFGRLRPYFHKVGIAFTDGVCSTDILVIRAKRPEWYGIAVLVASSDEMVRFADSRSTGTRMPRVSWKDLAQFPVVLPPDRVARAFDALVSPLLEKLRANALQSRTLAALRDALLPKLVSGEIRVSAAAPLVESVL